MRTPPKVAALLLSLIITTFLISFSVGQDQPTTKNPPAVAPQLLAPNKVEGMELPAPMEVDPNEDFLVIGAKATGDWKIEQVEWAVVNLGNKQIKFNELGDSIIVGLPAKGEVLFLYANALMSKETEELDKDQKPTGKKTKAFRLTKHAVTTITVKGTAVDPKVDPKDPAPVQGAPTSIPNGIRKIHVVMVYPPTAPDAVKRLSKSNAVVQALAKGESLFYPYETTPENIQALTKKGMWDKIKEAGVPSLLIVTNDKRVLPDGKAIPLPLGQDYARNEFILLDILGRATGGKPGQ